MMHMVPHIVGKHVISVTPYRMGTTLRLYLLDVSSKSGNPYLAPLNVLSICSSVGYVIVRELVRLGTSKNVGEITNRIQKRLKTHVL